MLLSRFRDHLSRGTWGAALGSALVLGACGDDGGSQSTGEASTSEGTQTAGTTAMPTMTEGMTTAETETGPMACPGTGVGMAAEGEACTFNGDCQTGVCLLFNDTPPTADATCGPTPDGCAMRITATLKNLADTTPIANTTVNIIGAVSALSNPTGATPLATATSDADGRVDTTTDEAVSEAFGIVAIITGGDFFTTATGVQAPNDDGSYVVGAGIHEYWAVPAADLMAWNSQLEGDLPEDALPLGDAGGVVGLVRDGQTGEPLTGATATGDGDTEIRYLQDDGSFDESSTGSSGIFVATGVEATGEDFSISAMDGRAGSGTAGSAGNVVFTLIVDVI